MTLQSSDRGPRSRARGLPAATDVPRVSPDAIAYTIVCTMIVSGLTRTAVYGLIGSGELQAVKSGRRTLVMGDSLRRYIGALPAASIAAPRKQAA